MIRPRPHWTATFSATTPATVPGQAPGTLDHPEWTKRTLNAANAGKDCDNARGGRSSVNERASRRERTGSPPRSGPQADALAWHASADEDSADTVRQVRRRLDRLPGRGRGADRRRPRPRVRHASRGPVGLPSVRSLL